MDNQDYEPLAKDPTIGVGDYVLDRVHRCLALVLDVIRRDGGTLYELERPDPERYYGKAIYQLDSRWVYKP